MPPMSMRPNDLPDSGRIGGNPALRSSPINPALHDPISSSRVTVVSHVIYHVRGGEPNVVQSRFGRMMETDEQAFTREQKVGEEWMQIPSSWIEHDKCGMLVLINREGKFTQRHPTEEERQEMAAKIIEVCFTNPLVICGPQVADQESGPRDMFSPPRSPEKALPPTEKFFAHLILPPGESCQLVPTSLKTIWLRCQKGIAKLSINVIPG